MYRRVYGSMRLRMDDNDGQLREPNKKIFCNKSFARTNVKLKQVYLHMDSCGSFKLFSRDGYYATIPYRSKLIVFVLDSLISSTLSSRKAML